MENNRNSFSSSLGFVLAAAGSAVGLGNIWRFPYLAAKDGGGLFLVIYILLALTFGFTMIVSETAIGRKTKQSALTAYGTLHKPSKWIGVFACIVPFMIFPYYCLIGGWVLKYAVTFLTGQGIAAAGDGYFTGFITGVWPPIIFDIIFLAATAFVIVLGVNKGIEMLSKILMPVLLVMVIGIAIFSLTIKGGDAGRTGLDGLKVYLIPDVSSLSVKSVFVTVMDAMGQLFYSISVAMGIMVTYGSYFKDDSNLMRSVNQIEIFDTVVAFLAGVMIIPAVFVFLGKEGMSAGPGLMFGAGRLDHRRSVLRHGTPCSTDELHVHPRNGRGEHDGRLRVDTPQSSGVGKRPRPHHQHRDLPRLQCPVLRGASPEPERGADRTAPRHIRLSEQQHPHACCRHRHLHSGRLDRKAPDHH